MMTRWSADVVILGSGFSGSIAAMILKKLGHQPLLVDRATHPRFAIGESSTPVANRLLLDLAERYDLPALTPLAKWGTWEKTYPQLRRGKKRGFSYFPHLSEQSFQPQQNHANELLVAASADDLHSDTQWFRADVDQFLVQQAQAQGVEVLDGVTIQQFLPLTNGRAWRLSGQRENKSVEIEADFILDGSGEAAALAHAFDIPSTISGMHTRSRAIFSHWNDIGSWDHWLQTHGADLQAHPFASDDAAQHHLFDGAWMWILRFSHGVASVGIAMDPRRWPVPEHASPEEEWETWLNRYPAVRDILGNRMPQTPPGRVIRTGRLQRRWHQIVGNGWAMLPHTAGFVDPLHSSGIAHSLCGVERLMRQFESADWRQSLSKGLAEYQTAVLSELTMIDQLVAACYSTFHHFPLLIANSMLYFAAATSYEKQRHLAGYNPQLRFLLAGDGEFTSTIERILTQLESLLGNSVGKSDHSSARPSRSFSAADISAYQELVARELQPFNHVGLCDWSGDQMYRYTAAPL
ncbi:MAG: NAD(P)/FAD-dependent oxidoreductase [Planctomycetota bacterium]